MARFVKLNSGDYADKLNHKIHENLLSLLNNELSSLNVCGVEKINVLLTLDCVNRTYLPSSDLACNHIFEVDNINYFNVVAALYIAKDDSKYLNLKNRAVQEAHKILNEKKGIFSCSESLHLFLDLLSCPYVSDSEKLNITKSSIIKISKDHHFKSEGISAENNINQHSKSIIQYCRNKMWFVHWDEIDLLMNLQRKLLKESY